MDKYDDQLAKAKAMDISDLVRKCIEKLRTDGYKGIHSVYSGFNEFMRQVHPDLDPVKIMEALSQSDGFGVRTVKGGAILYLPEDAKEFANTAKQNAARKIISKVID